MTKKVGKIVLFATLGLIGVVAVTMVYEAVRIKKFDKNATNLLSKSFTSTLAVFGLGQKDKTTATSTTQSGKTSTIVKPTLEVSTGGTTTGGTTTGGTTGGTTTKPKILFVLAGESNAGSQVLNTNASAAELGVRNNIQILNNSNYNFEPLNISGNNAIGQTASVANAHGWELGLANLVDGGAFAGKDVYLVCLAQGGSFIGQYNEGADTQYRNTIIARATAAMSKITPEQVYIVYSHGINDTLLGTTEASWQGLTSTHLAFLNTQFGGNCKIAITNFYAFPKYNGVINNIVASNPKYCLIDTNGFALQDEFHWNYTWQKELISRAVTKLKTI